MQGYRFCWYCKTCQAKHWYEVKACQRCGSAKIEKQQNGPSK